LRARRRGAPRRDVQPRGVEPEALPRDRRASAFPRARRALRRALLAAGRGRLERRPGARGAPRAHHGPRVRDDRAGALTVRPPAAPAAPAAAAAARPAWPARGDARARTPPPRRPRRRARSAPTPTR